MHRNDITIFSSADPKVSSAELMVLLICPSSWSVVVRHPSTFALNHYSSFSSYWLILNFLHEKLKHIVPPCNKARISNIQLEFQISSKLYSPFSSYSIILTSLLEKQGI